MNVIKHMCLVLYPLLCNYVCMVCHGLQTWVKCLTDYSVLDVHYAPSIFQRYIKYEVFCVSKWDLKRSASGVRRITASLVENFIAIWSKKLDVFTKWKTKQKKERMQIWALIIGMWGSLLERKRGKFVLFALIRRWS